jgi:hypothetical protein
LPFQFSVEAVVNFRVTPTTKKETLRDLGEQLVPRPQQALVAGSRWWKL